jgi:hypothetical protein
MLDEGEQFVSPSRVLCKIQILPNSMSDLISACQLFERRQTLWFSAEWQLTYLGDLPHCLTETPHLDSLFYEFDEYRRQPSKVSTKRMPGWYKIFHGVTSQCSIRPPSVRLVILQPGPLGCADHFNCSKRLPTGGFLTLSITQLGFITSEISSKLASLGALRVNLFPKAEAQTTLPSVTENNVRNSRLRDVIHRWRLREIKQRIL